MVERESHHRVELLVRGERVGLGPARRDLVPHFQHWLNDLRVTRTLNWSFRPLTEEAAAAWLEDVFSLEGKQYLFVIYDLTTLRPLGCFGLHGIDHQHGTANFAIILGEPDTWGKGYGTEATQLMLAYAFDVLGLYNVQLAVYANNSGAIRAYEHAGFKRIGARRGAHRLGRRRFDEVYMDAVADDFPPSHLHALLHPEDDAPAPPSQPPEAPQG